MQAFQHDHLMECPECGRKALVKQSNTIYQCLCCEFKRDLANPHANFDNNSTLTLIIVIITIVVMLGAIREAESPSEPQFQPSSQTMQTTP